MLAKAALIWVESFLGKGHMQVAAQISRALQAKGYAVTIATSNRERGQLFQFGGAEFVGLPPHNQTRINNRAVTENGKYYRQDVDWQRKRARILHETFDRVQPNVVVTELWPFERSAFDFELLPLLLQAKRTAAPVKCFSICRDVLLMSDGSGSSGRSEVKAMALVEHYFDGVIVRGDERLIRLEETYPDVASVREKLQYVGYFVNPIPVRTSMLDEQREVLVSASGGWNEEAMDIYVAAINAKHCCKRSGNALGGCW